MLLKTWKQLSSSYIYILFQTFENMVIIPRSYIHYYLRFDTFSLMVTYIWYGVNRQVWTKCIFSKTKQTENQSDSIFVQIKQNMCIIKSFLLIHLSNMKEFDLMVSEMWCGMEAWIYIPISWPEPAKDNDAWNLI